MGTQRLADDPVPLPSDLDERAAYRSIFLAYPDAVLLVDRQGTIVLANPAAERLLGYDVDELVHLEVDSLVPDGIRPRHAAYREGYARAPRVRPMGTQMELAARRKDGTEVQVEIALSPVDGAASSYVVASIRGIGEYPRVKQALQRARYSDHLARLGHLAVHARSPQTIIEQIPAIAATALEVDMAMVFLMEDDRDALRVVSGVGALTSEPVGTRIAFLPDTSPGLVLAQGLPLVVPDYRRETRFVVPPAYLAAGLVSALSVPVSDRGGIIGALTVRSRKARDFGADEVAFLDSVASLLATSLQRARSEEALSHAQRLESVGELTGGIAHDFNNLLTVIQGNLQVLAELPADADPIYQKDLIAAATRASHRGAELTAKLLAFSRRQMLQPSRVDIRDMLLSLASMLRRTLDQRITISVQTESDCPSAMADPAHLESALLNIAINARDAMPNGGALEFRAARCTAIPPDARAQLEDPGAPPDGFLSIAISDSGIGMSAQVLERVFEPFFTTKEAGRGTGLGLSTVYGFVMQSMGAITIESARGHGTTLTLYIPRARESEPESSAPEESPHEVERDLNVLLVEDDAEVRAVARTFLLALGCRVHAVSDAEQALLGLDAGSSFDLLLTDIALGSGMRGTELAARAQERFPGLAILLMSGFSSELIDADRDSPPGWELLRKPYSREELASAISRVVRPK